MDVVGGTGVDGVVEDILGGPRLDDVPGLAFSVDQEEGAVVRDPLRLLHVVRDDHDGDVVD